MAEVKNVRDLRVKYDAAMANILSQVCLDDCTLELYWRCHVAVTPQSNFSLRDVVVRL